MTFSCYGALETVCAITILIMCNLLRPWTENRYRTECKSPNKSKKYHI